MNLGHLRRRALLGMICAAATGFSVVSPVAPPASAATPGHDLRYVHDALGRLVAATDPAGSTTRYTYDANGNITSTRTTASTALAIDQISPSSAAPGATVSVDGTGFDAAATADVVRFDGVAAPVVDASVDHLTVTVPSGATNGPVSVTTAGRSATSSQPFTPVTGENVAITSVAPQQVVSGATITISGRGFDPSAALDDVVVNRTRATVVTATSTTITARVQAATGSGPVTISTPRGLATSTEDLFVTPGSAADARYSPGRTGPIAVGTATVVTLPAAKTYAQLTFDGEAGQHVAAKIGKASRSSGVMKFLDPRGNPLQSTTEPDRDAVSIIDEHLTEPGRYSLYLDFGGATGSATVTLTTVADTAQSGAIGVKSTAKATAAAQDVTVTVPETAGHQLSFAVTSVTTDTTVDLTVQAADGAVITTPRTFSGATFLEPYGALPFTGTYSVRLHFHTPGSMTLIPYDVVPDLHGSLAVDDGGKVLTFTSPGQNAVYTVNATADQRVALEVTTDTLEETNLEIDDPDGDDVWGGGASRNGAFSDVLVLPSSGTYTVQVNPVDAATGHLTLAVVSVPPDLRGSLTPGAPATTLTFTAPGQNADLTFTGTKGQKIALTTGAYRGNDRIDVEIDDPSGNDLFDAGVDTAGNWSDAITLPRTGTYHVRYDPGGRDTGSVTAQLQTVPADLTGSLTPGAPATTLTFTAPGQNADLTFTGTKGQKIALTTGAYRGNDRIDVEIDDPTNNDVYDSSAGADGDASGPLKLTSTGTYHVRYNPGGRDTGSVTSRLTTSGAAAATPQTLPPPSATSPRRADGVPSYPKPGLNQPPVSSAAAAYRSPYPDTWTPSGHDPLSHRTDTPWAATPLAHAPRGVTAIAGRVLTIAGMPLANVTLSVGRVSTRSDSTGRFLLSHSPFGDHTMVVDGTTANTPGRTWGRYEERLAIVGGVTTELSHVIWMTRLDTADTVGLPTTTTASVSITTPRVPGLEVRLPAGSSVHDDDGNPVRRIGITPIPIDRPPFPLPTIGVDVPLYFTVQPGSSYVEPAGAQVVYPNWTHLRPGAPADFWDYDADDKGWFVYGHGSVTSDGTQVAPDARTRVWEFSGAMFNGHGSVSPSPGPQCSAGGDSAGDPVSCSTGLLEQRGTDLTVPDSQPIDLTRNWRQTDTNSYAFGRGMNFTYGVYLYSQQQWQEVDLVLAEGTRVHFTRISSGNGWVDAVFLSRTPGPFFDAVIAYDGHGWLVTLRDGTVYTWGYLAPLQSVRDRFGNETTLTRTDSSAAFGDPEGPIIQVTSPNGEWISLAHTSDVCSSCVTSATDPSGHTVRYTYSDGNLTKVTDPRGGVTGYSYDDQNRIVSVRDPRGTTSVTYTYDDANRITTENLADGGTWSFAYTTAESGGIQSTQIIDPDGSVEKKTFDSAGYLTSDSNAFGTAVAQTTTFAYDPWHEQTSVTDPLGRVTARTYGQLGNLTSETELSGTPSARKTTYAYDPAWSQPTSVTDSLGHRTTATYDARGRLTSVTDPNGNSTAISMDPAGRVTAVTSASGHTSTFGYRFGTLSSVTSPSGSTRNAFSGSGGRPLEVTDGLGNVWVYTYDGNGDLVGQTDPLGGFTSIGHDADGNLTKYTDPRGNSTVWAFDSSDRVVSQVDPLGRTATAGYDLADNLVSTTDARGYTTSYRYDALERPVTASYGATSTHPSPTSSISYSYDDGNRVTKAVDSDNGTIVDSWDGFDELLSEATSTGTIAYTYDAGGRRTTMSEPGNADAVQYTYDAVGNLLSVAQGNVRATYTYTVDELPQTTHLPGGVVETTAYDADGRVSSLTFANADGELGSDTYAYDSADNRVSAGGSFSALGASDTISATTYDAANQLVSLNGVSRTYDADGNLTGDGARTYTWNPRDQLTSTAGPNAQTYGYDAYGRRANRTVSGTSTSYLYDGPDAVQERQGPAVSATMLDSRELDGHVARTDGNGTHAFLTDALNSTLAMTTSSGAISTTYTYSPFGAAVSSGAVSTNPYQFSGRERDGNTLVYSRARYYAPERGEFLSPDPIGLAGDGPQSHTYVDDDPTDLSDPLGLSLWNPSTWGPTARALWTALEIALTGHRLPGTDNVELKTPPMQKAEKERQDMKERTRPRKPRSEEGCGGDPPDDDNNSGATGDGSTTTPSGSTGSDSDWVPFAIGFGLVALGVGVVVFAPELLVFSPALA